MSQSPIFLNPNFYRAPNPYGISEAFLRNIWRRVHEKKFSYLCALTGRHRVGKSVSACVLAHLLDPTFLPNFESRVVYTPAEFMDAVDDLLENKIIGGGIVMDEANIGVPSREWYNISNKAINYSIQAFGYLRPIVFFVTQDITFIDSQPRKLFHSFFEVKRFNNEYSSILPFNIRFNKRTGKMYFVYPRFHGWYSGGKGVKLTLKPLNIMKPPKWFIDRYDVHSQRMKNRLIKQMRDMIHSLQRSESAHEDKLTQDEMVAVCLENIGDALWVTQKNTFRIEKIHDEFNIPFRWARAVKNVADVKYREKLEEEMQ